MKVEQAKEKLILYRQKQNKLRKQIDGLRGFLRDKGIDPDAPKVDLTTRNKAIYRRYLDGSSFVAIAKEYNLSAGRIRDICNRAEFMNKTKARLK
jgi:Mor family transcriptional regulator